MNTYTDSQLYDICHSLYTYSDGQLISNFTNKPITSTNSRSGRYICQIRLDGRTKCFYLHRIVFLMHHGYLPEMVDHINRNILDNHIDNLRAATRMQNAQNSGVQTNNKLGVKGVFMTYCGTYRAQIRNSGKVKFLGTYKTIEAAAAAYQAAAKEHHGEFASL